jgi:hypothetical protein
MLIGALCVSSDICTTASTPAKAKAGVRKPRQKLTPSLSHPPELINVPQTSFALALLLVASKEMNTMKKKSLRGTQSAESEEDGLENVHMKKTGHCLKQWKKLLAEGIPQSSQTAESNHYQSSLPSVGNVVGIIEEGDRLDHGRKKRRNGSESSHPSENRDPALEVAEESSVLEGGMLCCPVVLCASNG